MASELILRSGHLTAHLERNASALVLTCQRHVTEQAVPLHWPNAVALMRDFLDRHAACQADGWYDAPRLVAKSRR